MVDEPALFRAFEEYSSILLSDYDVTHVLHQLMDQVVDVLGVDGAGVCLGDEDGNLRFVAATNADVAVVEEEQVSENEGPCHDAHRTGELVVVDDLEAWQAWPSYRAVAQGRGVRAVVGVPLPAGDSPVGALNLYRSNAHEWSDHELRTGQLLANMASGYIVTKSTMGSSEELVRQLRRALESRTIIEQAKGVLAGRHEIGPDEAFDQIRTHARGTSSVLRQVCNEIVDGALDPFDTQPHERRSTGARRRGA